MCPDTNNVHPIELAWLAGFTDGEGYIGFDIDKRSVNTVTCNLTLTNTSFHTMGYVMSVLQNLQIPFEVRVDDRGERHKKCMRIRIRARDDITKLLKILEPYLITKKVQALVMLKYLSIRKIKGKRSEEETDLISEMRLLNRTGY